MFRLCWAWFIPKRRNSVAPFTVIQTGELCCFPFYQYGSRSQNKITAMPAWSFLLRIYVGRAKQFKATKMVSTFHIHYSSRSYQHVFFKTLIARLFNTFKRIFGAIWHILCRYATEPVATKPNLSSSRIQLSSFATQRHEFDFKK